jgi:dienelactone hydrolase
VDAARLGIYGTSYGGATVVFVAAIDPRVKCVVSGRHRQRGTLDAQRAPPGRVP